MTSIGGSPVQLSYSGTWAAGYAAAKEAGRAELEWQRAEIERLSRDLATFGKDTEATENRIIDAEFKAQELRIAVVKAIDILDRNLWRQTEKCEDAIAILRKATETKP